MSIGQRGIPSDCEFEVGSGNTVAECDHYSVAVGCPKLGILSVI